jgi:hypothetical protein
MQTSLNRLDTIWCQLTNVHPINNYVESGDRQVYSRRACSEGDSFRTDGLASLGRLLATSLRKGSFEKEIQVRFTSKKGSVLPLFLYKAWRTIFNDDGTLSGSLKTYEAVNCIRQLTLVYSKLPMPYPEDRVIAVRDRFIENERVMASFPEFIQDLEATSFAPPLGDVLHGFSLLERMRKRIARIIHLANPMEVIPRHGSGASACRTRPWERYGAPRYCAKIDKIWPYAEYFFAGYNHLVDRLDILQNMPELPRQARAVYVPKDYRGPRLISCEPRELTYVQQGLMTLLYTTLEHNVQTKGFVNFTDQSINFQLARLGSAYADSTSPLAGSSHLVRGARVEMTVYGENQRLATLDLKDASDLLRWDLVKRVFPPNWVDALDACRSTRTQLPCGTVVELNKHAPMGSSVCFPILALVIWSAIKAVTPPHTPVWVYGDDVIIPQRFAAVAIKALSCIGLTVNVDKSFAGSTPFRESCGGEFYSGVETTPIKLGSDMSGDMESKMNLVSFTNNIVRKYGSFACADLVQIIADMTGAPIIGRHKHLYYGPIMEWLSGDTKPADGEIPFALDGPDYLVNTATLRKRLHSSINLKKPSYQRTEYRMRTRAPVFTSVNTDDWSYVLRHLLCGGDEIGFTSIHALAKRVRYKYGWVVLD